jgi:hypothetical protein
MAYSPADQAVDTETASEVDSLVAPPQPASGVRRRALLGVAGACAVVAAGAAATAFKAPAEAAASSASALVSASNSTLKHRMGCANWKQILITEEANSDATKCHKLCDSTAGCAAYNLEASSCANQGDNQGKAPNTCYIFAASCTEKKNDCWDLHEESAPSGEDWKVYKSGMGCENWHELTLATLPDVNEHQCGLACSKDPACKRFNIQTKQQASCPGTNKVGTCYLFKAGCTEKANECWDLYDNLAYTTTTAAPGTTTR